MQQLDDLATNGKMHHYKIDSGLYLLLFHADRHLTDEQKTRAADMRSLIGKRPTKAKSVQIASDALALLNELRSVIPGPNYSAIYGQIQGGLADAQ